MELDTYLILTIILIDKTKRYGLIWACAVRNNMKLR